MSQGLYEGMTQKQKDDLLKRFMQEFFPFPQFLKIGFFTKEMKNDCNAQAKRVCDYFGYDTVYCYGSKKIRCHLSFEGERPQEFKEFITTIQSIYE